MRRERKPLPEAVVRQAYDDYFLLNVSWRALEVKYRILHGSLYAAFKRLGLPLRSSISGEAK